MATPSADQITQLGFAAVGADVAISDHCSIYGAGRSASETIKDFANPPRTSLSLRPRSPGHFITSAMRIDSVCSGPLACTRSVELVGNDEWVPHGMTR